MFVDKIDLNQKKLRTLFVLINLCKQSAWILVINNAAQGDLSVAIDARARRGFGNEGNPGGCSIRPGDCKALFHIACVRGNPADSRRLDRAKCDKGTADGLYIRVH